jgi:DMSO reductase anchor subunit
MIKAFIKKSYINIILLIVNIIGIMLLKRKQKQLKEQEDRDGIVNGKSYDYNFYLGILYVVMGIIVIWLLFNMYDVYRPLEDADEWEMEAFTLKEVGMFIGMIGLLIGGYFGIASIKDDKIQRVVIISIIAVTGIIVMAVIGKDALDDMRSMRRRQANQHAAAVQLAEMGGFHEA